MADTYDPILSKEELGRWRLFQSRPVPEPGIALVLSGDGQPLVTLKAGDRGLTNGELLWGKYNRLYKVDIGEHSLSFQCKLPCETDAFDFHAEVKLTCSVSKPELIVQRNIRDVRQLLEPLIIEVMRRISRKYKVEESGEAERAISRKVEEEVDDAGFKLNRFALTLSLEQEARQRIREKKDIQEKVEIEKTKLQGNLELEKNKIQGDLELEKFKQQLEMQRLESEMELKKVRMAFYGPIIQSGNWQLLAAQLSSNPQDVIILREMMGRIREQQQIDRHDKMLLLSAALEKGDLEQWKVGEFAKHLLEELTGIPEKSFAALQSSPTQNAELITDESEDKTSNSVPEEPDEFKEDEDN